MSARQKIYDQYDELFHRMATHPFYVLAAGVFQPIDYVRIIFTSIEQVGIKFNATKYGDPKHPEKIEFIRLINKLYDLNNFINDIEDHNLSDSEILIAKLTM